MAKYLIWLLVLVVGLLHCGCVECCIEEERLALLDIAAYMRLNSDPAYMDPRFNSNNNEGRSSSDCCQWDEVRCDVSTGRVTNLDLSYKVVPIKNTWLFNVTLFRPFRDLISLNLSYNGLNGLVEDNGSKRPKHSESSSELQAHHLNPDILYLHPSPNTMDSQKEMIKNINNQLEQLTMGLQSLKTMINQLEKVSSPKIPKVNVSTKKERFLTPLGMSYTAAFDLLHAKRLIMPVGPMPIPAPEKRSVNWSADKYCKYHRGTGHTTEECWAFKYLLQDKIESGQVILPLEE